jgi:hypothetical protein
MYLRDCRVRSEGSVVDRVVVDIAIACESHIAYAGQTSPLTSIETIVVGRPNPHRNIHRLFPTRLLGITE